MPKRSRTSFHKNRRQKTLPVRRPGGRSERVRSSVLTAAIDELADRGYAEFSIAAVAENAGVHVTSIYRKWGGRDALIVDACMRYCRDLIVDPDTGDLEEDLVRVLMSIVRLNDTRPGQALVALGFAAIGLPSFRKPSKAFWRRRTEAGRPLFERAIRRGEWPRQYDLEEIMIRLVGPILTRRFLLQEPVGARSVRLLVQETLLLQRKR
jgi:AcrR family transcriptional regulator